MGIHWIIIRGGADKFLARTGRKQTTATKLGIYSTYSPRSSIHFLARCYNSCKPLKKNSEGCPSNQVSAAAMTFASDEKWRPFNCFFQSRERVVVRRGQIRIIGWVVKISEAKVSQFFCRVEMPGEPWHCRARTTPTGELLAELAFFLQNVLQLHQQR